MPKIYRQKGTAYLILSEKESAQQEAEKLQKMIEAGGPLAEIGLAHGECALLLKSLGRTDAALESYRKAQEILQPGGATWRAAKLQEAFEDVLEKRSRSQVFPQNLAMDLEKLNTTKAEGCSACGRKFNLGDMVVLACGAWEGTKVIHESKAVFDERISTVVDRKYYRT